MTSILFLLFFDSIINVANIQVDIVSSPQQVVVMAGESPTYVVQFVLLAGGYYESMTRGESQDNVGNLGPVRRFKRLVEHLSSILQSSTQQR